MLTIKHKLFVVCPHTNIPVDGKLCYKCRYFISEKTKAVHEYPTIEFYTKCDYERHIEGEPLVLWLEGNKPALNKDGIPWHQIVYLNKQKREKENNVKHNNK